MMLEKDLETHLAFIHCHMSSWQLFLRSFWPPSRGGQPLESIYVELEFHSNIMAPAIADRGGSSQIQRNQHEGMEEKYVKSVEHNAVRSVADSHCHNLLGIFVFIFSQQIEGRALRLAYDSGGFPDLHTRFTPNFIVPIGVLNHLESIRRNFFYGVDGSDRKLAWIGWNMVLTSRKNGGALDTHKLIPIRSPWQDVILAICSLQSKCINLMDFIQKIFGNGENTSFWDDSWLGEVALKVLYKRLYALKMCKSISVAEKMSHPSLSHSFRKMPKGGVEQENYGLLCSKVADLVLPNILDRWCWILEGSQKFSVKSSRILIDNCRKLKFQLDGLKSFPSRYSLRDVVVNLALQKSIALCEFSTKACSLIR
nr:hypothetical protein [Tanacetum cinerariifolium]